jgi:hypothetical protein
MTPFDFLNAINDNKKDLFLDPQAEKDYSPFMINRGLSFFPDTVLYANEMNRSVQLPNKWQFDFLKNSIQKKKRFSKWFKKDATTDQLKLVMKHYNYSEKKAFEVLDVLTPLQIEEIRQSYEKGGRNS